MTHDLVREQACCPVCRGALRWSSPDDGRCASCGRAVPVVHGIPVLLPAESVFERSDAGPPGTRRSGGRSRLPSISRSLVGEQNLRRLRSDLEASGGPEPAAVLVIGAGNAGKATAVLAGPAVTVVETDVVPVADLDAVVDAHTIPFPDGTFDAVVAQAVLEHVLDPAKVVQEIHRVLRPGGLVYAATPFMQQVHEAAYDFTRWTHLGHRRLFRWFDEIDSGISVGPASALAWSVRAFLQAFARTPRQRRLLGAVAHLGTWWLKHLDRVLSDRPGALDAASSTYFYGRSSASPISDHDLLAGYRGARW